MENINVCNTCVFANILVTDEILCSKYGVLNSSCACKRYKEDLTKKEIRKKRTIKIKTLEQ